MNLLDLMVNIRANDQATPVINGVSSGTVAKGAAVGNLVSQGISAAAGAIIDFGKQTIQTGMDFDSAMSQVAATMGVTTDDIGQLRDMAKDMGSSTKFSATEAAEALNYMALAGYDVDTSMTMLPTVLDLAAAGGMDLAAASDMVTDSQTALGLSTEETAALVDQMAQTASKSNTSVSQLGDAILTVGGTAKNLSGGVTEMNTVLGIMADNGIKGSEAGTHLRNVILSLSAPTDVAAKAMADLGVSAVDADGNLRPLEDTMQDFNRAFEGMTQEEKTQALSKIFNKTDLAAVNALLDTNVERWDELGSAIDDSAGSASQMAATMQDNLEGAMTSMNSAIEGIQIGLSEMMTPALREMVDTATSGFQQMASQLSAGDLVGAFTTLGETVANLASQFLTAIPSIIDAGLQMITGLVQGLAQGAPQLVMAATQAVIGLVQAVISNAPQMIAAALNLIQGLAQGVLQALPVLIAAIPPLINGAIQAILTMLPMMMQAGIQLFSAIVQNLPAILAALIAAIPPLISGLIQGILTMIPMLAEAGVQLFSALVMNAPQIIASIVSAIPGIIGGIVDGFMGGIGEFFGLGNNMANETANGMAVLPEQVGGTYTAAFDSAAMAWAPAPDYFGGVTNSVSSTVTTGMSTMSGAVTSIVSDMSAGASGSMNELEANGTAAFNELYASVVADASAMEGEASSSISSLESAGSGSFSSMESSITSAANSTQSSVNSSFSKIESDSTQSLNKMASGAESAMNKMKSTVDSSMNSIGSTFSTNLSNILTAATSTFDGFTTAATSSMTSTQSAVESAMSSAASIVTSKASEMQSAMAAGCNAMMSTWNNMHFSTPHIPLPHFSASGSFNPTANPPSVPSFSVSWYKQGAILDGATIFGMMGNKLLGGGEAGREAVLPVDKLTNYVQDGVNKALKNEALIGKQERNFTFNVTINANGNTAEDYGRQIAEALYVEVARSERNLIR